MKWAEFTLLGRMIASCFAWLLLAPFFAGLALGHAGFLEGAFWTLMIAAWVGVPLVLIGSALLDRRSPAMPPESHGQFVLGARKRTVVPVTRLDHRMKVMPREELVGRVTQFKALCPQLNAVVGENCTDCGHVALELESADGERVAVVLSLETPRQYLRTQGLGFLRSRPAR